MIEITPMTENFLQVLTPEDECAKHGREWMAQTRPRHQFFVDGEPRGDKVRHWVCVSCLMENTEVVRAKLAERDAELAKIRDRSECIYCGMSLSADEDSQDSEHWKTCEEHPARAEVEELREKYMKAMTACGGMSGELAYLRNISGRLPKMEEGHLLEAWSSDAVLDEYGIVPDYTQEEDNERT